MAQARGTASIQCSVHSSRIAAQVEEVDGSGDTQLYSADNHIAFRSSHPNSENNKSLGETLGQLLGNADGVEDGTELSVGDGHCAQLPQLPSYSPLALRFVAHHSTPLLSAVVHPGYTTPW